MIENDQILKGRWVLTPNHEIAYRRDGLDEEFFLKAPIIAVEPDLLVIAVTEKQKDQQIVTNLAKLTGTWQLDSTNQIIFEVQREQSQTDTLTFTGAWRVGKNNEVVYSYEQKDLKRKSTETHTLTFNGTWSLSKDRQLAYSLGVGSNSRFDFKGAFETGPIYPKKGEIRYRVGVEVRGKTSIQTITLFGQWRLSRDLYLDFDIQYENGQRNAITFGGTYNLDPSRQITVSLKSKAGEPLGLALIVTQDLFDKDGQAFIRLQKTLEESSIEAGVDFRW